MGSSVRFWNYQLKGTVLLKKTSLTQLSKSQNWATLGNGKTARHAGRQAAQGKETELCTACAAETAPPGGSKNTVGHPQAL